MTDTIHTDSVEATIEEILNDNRGETLYDSENANEIAADAIDNFIEAVLPKLQAHTSQQVEELTAEITDLKATCFTMDDVQQQVEEAVRKLSPWLQHDATCFLYLEEATPNQCDCGLSKALTPNHQD